MSREPGPGPADRSRRASGDEVLFEAQALEGPARGHYLDQACGDDKALRAEVESLLEMVEQAEGFLETPPQLTAFAGPTTLVQNTDRSGQRLGSYLLKEPLAAGGMGQVYLAERADGAFEKRVAVKLIRSDLQAVDLERRFATERQALAGLEHPNIARLLDGGTSDDGLPYLVMEHVEGGVPIDQACVERKLPVATRLRHFLDVCHAVQHAHGKLIVHRDIKPNNVLLDPEGRVKLLDFGIAKILGTSSLGGSEAVAAGNEVTVAGAHAMTPAYASPEQLAGEPVTTATDVYSLGALLHVLLTGRLHAEDGSGLPEGDLGHILDRALQVRPAERYATAEQLAADIRRHLSDQPVVAAPDSLRYRAGKFYRRNRIGALAGAAVAAALLLATVVSVQSARSAAAARDLAETERHTAEEVSGFLESVLGSIDPNIAQGRDVSVLADAIDRAAQRIPRELARQPEVAGRLHATVGDAYQNIARYEEAEQQLRRAVELQRGSGSAELAETLVQLGGLLTQVSRDEEAEEAFREAVGIARELGEQRAAPLVSALAELGDSLSKQAESEEAELVLREALEIGHHELPADHPGLARALDRLGWLLATTDRAADGESYLRDAVRIRRLRAEAAPLPLANVLSMLAFALRRQNQYDEAQALSEEHVELSRRLLGPDHPNLGTALSQLASLHEFRGHHETALGLYQEALEVQKRGFGEIHREVGTTQNNLGGLLRRMGRLEEAERTMGEAMATYAAALGEEHAWTTIALSNLVWIHLDQGHWAKTERTVLEYLERSRELWPEEHWRNAAFESVRGACLRERGEYVAAEEILLQSYRHLEENMGPEHGYTRDARQRLVLLYEQTGRAEEAQAYRSRAGDGG